MQQMSWKSFQSVSLKSKSDSRLQQVLNIVTHALFVIPCSDCMPIPAERALARHRAHVWDVLVEMFEKPIP